MQFVRVLTLHAEGWMFKAQPIFASQGFLIRTTFPRSGVDQKPFASEDEPSHDRPKLLKHVVTAPLPNAGQQV